MAPNDLQGAIDKTVRDWLDVQFAVAVAGADTEEDVQALNMARHLHLDNYWYTLSKDIVALFAKNCDERIYHEALLQREAADRLLQANYKRGYNTGYQTANRKRLGKTGSVEGPSSEKRSS